VVQRLVRDLAEPAARPEHREPLSRLDQGPAGRARPHGGPVLARELHSLDADAALHGRCEPFLDRLSFDIGAGDTQEDLVARADPDRYVASLFARPERRGGLVALYHFNLEVARIRDVVREPLVGHIRLGWWREQIAAIYQSRAVAPPLSHLAAAIDAFALPVTLFEAYLDARSLDLSEAPFADEAALEAYTAATAGSLMQLATRICGAGDHADHVARHAGLAAAYAGFIRSLGLDIARRCCRLPISWLEAEGMNTEDVFAAKHTPSLERVVARLALAARTHLRVARTQNIPRPAMPALAPAALVERYLAHTGSADLFAQAFGLSRLSRIARLSFAVITGRI
jgi:phytoene synthase